MGDLIEVAFVGDQVEGDMIQALLEAHQIRSLQQQVGPSGPQLGYGLMSPGGGARRVMVHPDRAERARALIIAARAEQEQNPPDPVNARYSPFGC